MTPSKAYSKESREFFFGPKLMSFYVDHKFNRKMYVKYLDSVVNSKTESNKSKLTMLDEEADLINYLTYPEVASPKKDSPNLVQTIKFLTDHPGLDETLLSTLDFLVYDYVSIQKMVNEGVEILFDTDADKILTLESRITVSTGGYHLVRLGDQDKVSFIIPVVKFNEYKKEGLIQREDKYSNHFIPNKEMVAKKNLKDAMNKEFSEGNSK